MSFAGERSPKRQRLESYSPASPPLHTDTKSFVPPQTPPPSVRMSPSWTAQSLPNTQQQQSTSGNTTTFPTPPSTSGFLSSMAGRGAGSDAGGDSGRQTPASDYGTILRKDGDGDAEMSDRPDSGGEADVSIGNVEHRRTDHERQKNIGYKAPLRASAPGVLALYRLRTDPVAPAQPHPSQDLIELYGLRRIQQSVARRDPVTGEKINKLRKSYENKVKALGLEGRNKAQANQAELENLLHPDYDMDLGGKTLWQENKELGGRKLDDPQAQEALFSKLDAALKMTPGHLPIKEHKEWQNILGLDELPGGRTPAVSAMKPLSTATAASAIAKTAPVAAARSSAPTSPRDTTGRPERTGKKRRYDDNSFEGYTGYEEDGYSTGGVDDTNRRGSGPKRQKRKEFVPSTQNSPSFANGPNNSMVDVRSS